MVNKSVSISVSSSELERCTLVTFRWEFIICDCWRVEMIEVNAAAPLPMLVESFLDER